MKASSTKALIPKGSATKALVTRLHAGAVARTLQHPTCRRLAAQLALFPAAGSIAIGVANLLALGAGALHGGLR
jgi:hypothetical protein